MRLDHFITVRLIRPLRRAVTRPSLERSIPVLMYHNICDDPEPGVPAYYQTNTSSAVFRQHMQFLADNGYQTISVADLVNFLHTSTTETNGIPKPNTPPLQHSNPPTRSRSVVLTFDDAFRTVYTQAFPVLQQHGFTASVFLPTAFIGDTRRQFRPSTLNCRLPASPECLTWSEVLELRRHGLHFGSHTVSHPELVKLPWVEVKRELSDSKCEIEQRLGEPATEFCYPFAFPQAERDFTERLRGLLTETGYSCCLTTQLGRVQVRDDPFRIKRLPANSLDDESLFVAKLDGAYDWLAWPQRAVKTLKR